MPGKAAARNFEAHVSTQPLPPPATTTHVGEMIKATGTSKVFINGQHAAEKGDMCVCPESGNTINIGSSSVFIGGKAAARQMDQNTHTRSYIQQGSLVVFIGD